MRLTTTLRGLRAGLLALYVGVGIGAPVADALVFHLRQVAAPIHPSIDDGSRSDGRHDVCLLGQQARESITPAVDAAPSTTIRSIDRAPALLATAPRDATPAGLPLSRAPPRI
jgi:hypothetical protein